MPQLLLEIFSEEIPARMQQGAARDLERMVSDRLKAAGLTWDALTTYAGPRRLTLVIDGLPAATPDCEEELKGPRASAPEQALEGFLRKTGLTRDQLTERDGVLFAVLSSKGRATTDLVAETVDQVIRTFPWPKSMRWGSGTLRWVRPIKRILCLFDGKVVPFEIDGIPSDAITEGHRFMGSGQLLKVSDFVDYRTQLEQNFVLLDVADRKLRILDQAKAACAAKGLVLVDDDGLLDEVAGLAEWPTPILGDMDPQFLALPPEVVRLSMKVHQKYFAVRGSPPSGGSTREAGEGGAPQLAPNFLVVANVEATDGGKALAAGNSRVLSARLNDARFFWDEDQKVGFDAWNAKLSGVTFHAKLGTLAERVERIAALAREIAPLVGADAAEAETAARLSKADLLSGMVSEFPELQGIMGGYYARLAGHSDAVADAVRDHYKPQGPADTVPTAPVTVAVALADKLDTLVGFFAIDEKPTGSKDPYALRRAALGVIRLVLENGVRTSLADLIVPAATDVFDDMKADVLAGQLAALDIAEARGVEGQQLAPARKAAIMKGRVYVTDNELLLALDVAVALSAFFADRLTVLLRDQGQRHDLVAAVFALGDDDLVRIVRRVEALAAFLATDDGANLLAGYKRASNILRAEEKKGPVPTGMVQTGLPNQPEPETVLAFAVASARTAVETALETEDFAAAMTALARLRAPVDRFFEDVLVNSDVPAERDNRLKLLGQVRDVMGQVADFGQIAG
ncbi:MAG: glycine--tRNA ligase subunit beta [Alphaproteobacteria bacterium]|uniref:glycine--tRNA ligase subunit beta n=1 Tax=Brevundimonas sp. TaxID=1871086 RepID=UPI001E17C33A|nr:glycine--tRNA ligase subunit beta [Alphaproteobacteria bacterium]MBU1522829.1 glycine--tRNA ligase subunit beta [Alphaproteobacteria bacterium]MBU2163565.1 glycine--tRNA ligase subunit beta [Alphaproteobacteria bacterium]MBU2230722.1 glycine--tRNA ligase subunit beta [Alphaproteobacteria bacterium]MBU2348765.1 glycine--tRNA ligase subunit beta [Alphaproteobacteria bacterium]